MNTYTSNCCTTGGLTYLEILKLICSDFGMNIKYRYQLDLSNDRLANKPLRDYYITKKNWSSEINLIAEEKNN